MTRREMEQRRRLRSLLSLLVALLGAVAAVLTATTAAASAASFAETRVGASSVVVGVPVEPPQHEPAGQRLGNDGQRVVTAVATGVAADAAGDACKVNSFTGETLILMADGTKKPIKEVKLGDRVIATDPNTGERGPRKVTDLIRHGGLHTMVAVRLIGGTMIDATDQHPFWVESRNAWVDAIDLKPGDHVRSAGRPRIEVQSVKVRAQDLTAYNLTVADLHTYYVSAAEILVHNCPSSSHSQRRMDDRGVSQADIDTVLEREPFSYWHEDQWKSGFYDPKSKVFVAKTIDGTVNTVMTNVDKAYVSRLQKERP